MRIVNFGQVVDLEHGGGFAHQFTVMLDSGERLSIITDEDTVQQLIEIVAAVPQEMPEPDPRNELARHLRSVHEQYGDQELRVVPSVQVAAEESAPDPGELADYEPPDEEPASQPVMGVVSEAPVRNVPTGIQPGGLGQPKPPVRRQPMIDQDGFMVAPTAKTVPTDEMGYPITSMSRMEPDPEDDEEDVGEQV